MIGMPKVKVVSLEKELMAMDSLGPNASRFWSLMPEKDILDIRKEIWDLTWNMIEEAEKEKGVPFSAFIAHHCWHNSIIFQEV